MPDAGRTHGPPATKNAGGSHHRLSRARRHSPRDGVNGCSALSSGLRACWPPSPCDNRLAGLTPASGGQDHTAWPSEKMPSSARKRAEHPLVHRIPLPTSMTIAIRPLCPGSLAECANGRLCKNRPLLELSPLRPKSDRACSRARDSSGVFLNPNSCKGFEPEPSKEGSG